MEIHKLNLLAETLPLALADRGSGRPYLLLHGAAGPSAMAGLAEALSQTGRAVLPTHPGFDGAPRPEWCRSIHDLATAYLALLDRLDLREVVVIGNSMGGWLAAELALQASPRVAALVLLNAAGLDATPASGSLVNPATIPPAERAAYAFHNPARFAVPPAPTAIDAADAAAKRVANQQMAALYGGSPFMQDPTLRSRLPTLAVPTLVLWGASDRILPLSYGQQFAGLIPGVQFEVVPEAGHFPQIEQLDAVLARIKGFCEEQ